MIKTICCTVLCSSVFALSAAHETACAQLGAFPSFTHQIPAPTKPAGGWNEEHFKYDKGLSKWVPATRANAEYTQRWGVTQVPGQPPQRMNLAPGVSRIKGADGVTYCASYNPEVRRVSATPTYAWVDDRSGRIFTDGCAMG